jgi:hypothetical protein
MGGFVTVAISPQRSLPDGSTLWLPAVELLELTLRIVSANVDGKLP